MLKGKAKEDFEKWYKEKYGTAYLNSEDKNLSESHKVLCKTVWDEAVKLEREACIKLVNQDLVIKENTYGEFQEIKDDCPFNEIAYYIGEIREAIKERETNAVE